MLLKYLRVFASVNLLTHDSISPRSSLTVQRNGNFKFSRLESKELCEKAIKALNGKPVTQGGEPLIVKFAEAPNPNKKRPLVYFAPAWAGAGMEENGQIPAMSFVQPMFSDVSLQQNGASAIPTPGPRPLLIHPCEYKFMYYFVCV